MPTEEGLGILSYLPEGVSVAAVLITVVCFLKHQAKQADQHERHMDRIVGEFRETIQFVTSGHDNAIGQISTKLETHTRATSAMNENLVRLITKLESQAGNRGEE